MPEVLEIESYRRAMAPIVGRIISGVEAPDAWYLKGGVTGSMLEPLLLGEPVVGLRRRGKLLLVDLGDGPTLGLRFGMTGRPLVDAGPAPMELQYSSRRSDPAWVRFALRFGDGGRLAIEDPRRLGGVELDPDESALGPDALAVSGAELDAALDRRVALKAALLDQSRLAGLGNMLVDEVLYRAGLDPARTADALSETERSTLFQSIRRTLPELMELGGSHRGALCPAVRVRGGRCPQDGTELERRTIGGRTTYSCPSHQR